MGRPEKSNFEFFRLETNFFSNAKIKSLRRLYGSIGLSTYIYLLCYIYGHDGYYMRFSSVEDLSHDIAESIAGDNIGKVARRVAESINYLANSDLIDKGCMAEGIITSVSIQGQYIAMCRVSKRVIKMDKFCLLDEGFVLAEKNRVSSEETPVSSEETHIYKSRVNIKENYKRKDFGDKRTATTRTYTKEELDSLVDDIETVDF